MQSHTQCSSIDSNPFQTPHSRWLALTRRAPSSHSSFLYGVKSTKIYCRPTCSARLARRANIVFYDTEDQARRDGFRPCKRCKPDITTFAGEGEEIVTRALALLRVKKDDMTVKKGLKELAAEVGVTPSYLCRVFKRTMGLTIGTYMKEFEKEAPEVETESIIQSPSKTESGAPDMELGPLTPAMTASSCSSSVKSWNEGSAEANVANVEDFLDLDFDFDEWFWTKDFPNDNIYG